MERSLREAAEEEGVEVEELSSLPSLPLVPPMDPSAELHLLPQPLPLPPALGPVALVSCGSQHTLILSRSVFYSCCC